MSHAPVAPGALGERLDPAAVQTYLGELATWVQERRADLAELDAAALEAAASKSSDGGSVTGDLMLSMSLWKAVSDREQLLLAVWDGGRVGLIEQERLSVLIWGRLEGATSLSLPEACRLSDALAQQLRVHLSLDPAADTLARSLKALRASVERLREQAALEPAGNRAAVTRQIEEIASRTQTLAEKLTRGADIGGLIGPLENDAALLERDLIVGGARRREALGQRVTAQQRVDELTAQGAALQALATRTIDEVAPAPHYAIPDVKALGAVPEDQSALAAYLERLERVAQALTIAHERYSAALTERDDLVAQLDAATVRSEATGVRCLSDVVAAERAARDVLDRRPSPIPVARHLVAAHQEWIELSLNATTRLRVGGRESA